MEEKETKGRGKELQLSITEKGFLKSEFRKEGFFLFFLFFLADLLFLSSRPPSATKFDRCLRWSGEGVLGKIEGNGWSLLLEFWNRSVFSGWRVGGRPVASTGARVGGAPPRKMSAPVTSSNNLVYYIINFLFAAPPPAPPEEKSWLRAWWVGIAHSNS